MAYEPTNWATGDTISAEKLNKIEGGIESAQFPTITSADIGKPLGVVPVAGEPKTLLAPEQDVVYGGIESVNLENCINLDEFANNAFIELIVDGVSYMSAVQREEGSILQVTYNTPDGSFYLAKTRVGETDYTLSFTGAEAKTYSVIVTKPTVVPSIGLLDW